MSLLCATHFASDLVPTEGIHYDVGRCDLLLERDDALMQPRASDHALLVFER